MGPENADETPARGKEGLANPPESSVEAEIAAIGAIHSRLAALKPTARVRVFKYVSELLAEGE